MFHPNPSLLYFKTSILMLFLYYALDQPSKKAEATRRLWGPASATSFALNSIVSSVLLLTCSSPGF
jgi:hypothetical protein